MKRKAVLIGGPGKPGSEGYLLGVKKDLNNYSTFLCSELGGAWERDEISILLSPSKSAVQTAIEGLKQADYSVALFSGHGCYRTYYSSTFVELQTGIEMNANDLKVGAKKHTLILDCCRVSVSGMITEVLAKADRAAPSLNRPWCRQYFEKLLDQCPQGLAVLYACAKNETAGDISSQGGRYSVSLLNTARDWLNYTKVDVRTGSDSLSVVHAHEHAAEVVRKSSGDHQNPEIEKPRSTPYFPFAVLG